MVIKNNELSRMLSHHTAPLSSVGNGGVVGGDRDGGFASGGETSTKT